MSCLTALRSAHSDDVSDRKVSVCSAAGDDVAVDAVAVLRV